ncbi:acetyltransferase (GNAT) family protein [Antricoccus suffuscus]|uniref:Acetyltransferase (GNAT) family protein n=1 Tax=Antricoccus suffuscus TaxID=1629062 RepID=A0A2T0ZWK7_9ACTN|nr:GNAT family N-acetyltransferase [Antricoccus suffuscus]PRZ40739.1 acetyltransferase (GNAT) family protein [Antricoccus suffuscus]
MRARVAEERDLALLGDIEAAADQMFAPLIEIAHWGTPPTGRKRAESGGRLFVIGDPAVGFAHVTEIDGHFHLEQLAVHPDHGRRGLGTELVYAAAEAIADRGGDSMTLLTFADVPWNAPFYRKLGFEVVDPAPDHLSSAIAEETRIGLKRGGPRVAMARAISPHVEARPAVSVIPIRDGERGLEVYVQHRVHTMDFAPGVVVFPGGRIDPIDTANAPEVAHEDLDELAEIWRDSSYVSNSDDPRLAVRVLLATGIREMAEETGIQLSPPEVLPWDDWTTPPAFPKRFQVHFMVVHLPTSDPRSPRNTTTEAFESEWLPVSEVLDRGNGGDLQLMTPTRVILRELAHLGSASAVLGAHPDVTPVHNDRAGVRPRPTRKSRLMTEG